MINGSLGRREQHIVNLVIIGGQNQALGTGSSIEAENAISALFYQFVCFRIFRSFPARLITARSLKGDDREINDFTA